MKLTEITPIIGKIPHMTKSDGELIYKMILENDIFDILELGTAHGTGSCYMAAALDEKSKGSVITIDITSALNRKPNIHELLKKSDLERYVTPIFANSSYNWELMKLIDRQTIDGFCEPIFDFCFIDGAHNFEIDCCAFHLVDKLLRPGGLILFDDMNWTYASSPSLKNTDWVKKMAKDEKETPHIKKLVELVALNHPNYVDANLLGDWFLIRKKTNINEKQHKSITLNQYKSETTLSNDLKEIARKFKNRLYTKINAT
ncbi:MAG TPA: class I SAM-dependent methyltransferase [Bacteroidales bacterium]|nr:class I SAM-dependent methyltransferase [Bacteroidales bacterium]